VKHIAVLAAVCLVACSFLFTPRPAAEGPVATALRSASSSDRQRLAGLYAALADVVARDSGRLIATTAQWRAVYSDALRLAVGGTSLVGKYPGLDKAVDDVLAKHYPLNDVPLGDELVKDIVAGLRDVEAQCGGR
jgi:hypothetical protein